MASKIFPVAPFPAVVKQRAHASARRLQLDRIPLYQVHQPNPLVPDSVIMPGMRDLLDSGTIGAAGVSNYSLERWQKADAALGRPVISNQVDFSLARPGALEDLVPFAERENRIVIAYSPLAQGLLGGKYGVDNRPGGVRVANSLFGTENLRRVEPLLQTLRDVATAAGRQAGAGGAGLADQLAGRGRHSGGIQRRATRVQRRRRRDRTDPRSRATPSPTPPERSGRCRPLASSPTWCARNSRSDVAAIPFCETARTTPLSIRSEALRIVVVGSGISGLTTAISLLEAGHRVRLVAAEPSTSTTSALAAAVWFPTHVGPWERVLRWGEDTYRVLADHAATRVAGVVMRESLGLYRQPPAEPAWAAAVGGVRPATADELPPGYRHGLRFVVPLAEMPRYLPWLVARIHGLGGEFVQRHVWSLEELGDGADVVVNCAGLGARELVGDSELYPVRGQIVRVSNPGLTMSVRDEQHPAGRAYVHPRVDDCILGGTLEERRWDTTVDLAAGAAIVERCCDLVPALRGRTGDRASGRTASGPLDRSTRGGRATRFRCAGRAQLRARRSGRDVELGLRSRGTRACRAGSPIVKRIILS